jgi:DNA-binding NarL/FixJ family response regulator
MKQVASEINVKPGTVAFHKYRMMETLNISSKAELPGLRTQAPDDAMNVQKNR